MILLYRYGTVVPVVVVAWADYLCARLTPVPLGIGTGMKNSLRFIRQFTIRLAMEKAGLKRTGTDCSRRVSGKNADEKKTSP